MDPTELSEICVRGITTFSERLLDEQVDNNTSQNNLPNSNLSNTGSSKISVQCCNTSDNSASLCSSTTHNNKAIQREAAIANSTDVMSGSNQLPNATVSKIKICTTIQSDEANNISSSEGGNQLKSYGTETGHSETGPSKEEKQRQNEEIVCMVTSVVSPVITSLETVLPFMSTDLSASILNKDLLAEEPIPGYKGNFESSTTNAVCNVNNSTSTFQNTNKMTISTSGHSACFIDASSLCDEEEVISYVNLDINNINETHAVRSLIEMDQVEGTNSPTNQLEEFHKSFARCKGKVNLATDTDDLFHDSHHTKSTSSSNSGEDTPHKPNLDSTNNLSDEEKIWKREQTNSELKNSSSLPELIDRHFHTNLQTENQQNGTEETVSVKEKLDSSDSMCKLRPEQRAMDVSVNCQENILQFSMQPLVDKPKLLSSHFSSSLQGTVRGGTSIQNDISNTTDYSSSSPAPSLVWSDHEHRTSLVTGLKRQPLKDCLKNNKVLPDTPHNSMVYVESLLNNSYPNHRGLSISSSLSHHRDSGTYCSDATESPTPVSRTPKRSKFDEDNPIISGGASIADYSTKCESPKVKRKTDSCPIVSGGFVSFDKQSLSILQNNDKEKQTHAKSKMRKTAPFIASWIVDMSDCGSEYLKSSDTISNVIKCDETFGSSSPHKSGCGFYVSLDDGEKNSHEKYVPKTIPNSTGFFVNLDQSISTVDNTDMLSNNNSLFNMFIDIGDKTQKVITKQQSRYLNKDLSSSLTQPSSQKEHVGKSDTNSLDTLKDKNTFKPLTEEESCNVGGFCEKNAKDVISNSETLAINRRNSQSRNHYDSSKRHSWETSYNSMECNTVAGDYKRSTSLTACSYAKENKDIGLMSIIDKLPIISKASSLSIDSSLSPLDEITGSKSIISTSSNNSAINTCFSELDCESNINISEKTQLKKRRCDVKINETFDKSSIPSITDDTLSKDLSLETISDKDDMTFQQGENLVTDQLQHLQMGNTANRSSTVIMETIIESKETSSPNRNSTQKKGHTMETLHATIEKQKMLLETVNEVSEVGKSTYVKLSDMDKPINYDLTSSDTMSKSLGYHRQINRVCRDDSKARPHSWSMTHSSGNRLFNITNSVDNLRSLSRLFPNLSQGFSNSLPNDIILQQMDYAQTDISADTSLASSFSRSAMEESSISCRQPRRLGEDLLKMFLQEIATDLIVEVHGRRIKAHKCILRSRCQYFAAILAGNDSHSIVTLEGYSYSAVHFALCHIYSGASHPPDGISLMELAALADLLGLEGLKEVTSYALKTNYCHNFHKPCSGCIDGILQVLPVALNHALDDLYRKCLRWTCRHYLKVWPTRQFAQLPQDIMNRCRQQIVAYLTFETVLDVVLDCEHLLGQLSTYRWGNSCENLVRDIREAAHGYIADHFASLIASDSFLSLGHDRSGQIPCLENLLLRTSSSLTPDQACRSYQRITRLNTVLQAKILQMPSNLGELASELQGLQEEDLDWDPEYIRLVSELLLAVEQCLIRQCSFAMRVTAWQRMDLSLRKKIQTLARLTEPLETKRSCKPVSKASSFGGGTRNQDLFQIKMAMHAYSRRSYDPEVYKAPQTDDKSKQIGERTVPASNNLVEGKILKSNSRAKIPQVRSISHTNTEPERTDVKNPMNKRNPFEIQPPVANYKTIQKSASVFTPVALKSNLTRLSDVRPRYLQPRKTHGKSVDGPIRSATISTVPIIYKNKGLHISSSDSSPYSSPVNALQSANKNSTKTVMKEASKSTDTLTSRDRRAKSAPQGQGLNSERYSDITMDSLAESMKSSRITNKTISNESLTSTSNKRIHMNQLNLSKTSTSANKANPNMSNATVIKNTSNRRLQQKQINSNGSSASSIQTSKSTTSRLSSVGSIQTTRTVSNHGMISISNTGNGQNKKFSFLSAKSRKILAKRAEKNKLQQQDNLMHKKIQSDEIKPNFQNQNVKSQVQSTHSTVNQSDCHKHVRNTARSQIPTRRSNTVSINKSSNGVSRHKLGTTTVGGKNQNISNAKSLNYGICTGRTDIQECDLLINATTTEPENIDYLSECVKSKLERSSTFCKDPTDLVPDIKDLQARVTNDHKPQSFYKIP